jgi:hypothetical protein
MVKNSTATEKEIISMVWRDSGRLEKNTGIERRYPERKIASLLREYVWRYNHRNENDNHKVKRFIKLLEHEV